MLSLLQKEWVFPPEAPRLENNADVVRAILANRRIETPEEKKVFLEPTLKDLSPLNLIPNIASAAQYLLNNLQRKITVYGDYDVDGVTGTALLYTALKKLGASQIDYYIPHRFTEGYGLNKEAVSRIKSNGTEIILTVDCGISNYEEIKYAKELGLNVIVTDHHMPPVVYPPADFLVNPKMNNQPNACRNISGVAVAFKFVEQMFQLRGSSPYAETRQYLDLVLLGTIADIVPLLEENRVLAMLGLKEINLKKRTGVCALADVSGLSGQEISCRDVGFGLGPRINAAGRMDSSALAVKLLLENDYQRARQIAIELNEHNIQRRALGDEIKNQVIAEIEKLPDKDSEKVFILASEGWHPGIIGIVASHIAKQYNRPTALIAISEKGGRGSIRSLEGLDIFEPLKKCAYLLKDFGGHKEAAGFEVEKDRIEEFKETFRKHLSETLTESSYIPLLSVDAVLPKQLITKQLAEALEKLKPFGQNNQEPIFTTGELSIYDFSKIGGGKHLRFSLTDGVENIDGVGFGMGDLLGQIQKNTDLEIAFNLSINEWGGKRKLQLIIKDLRPRA